MQLKNPYRLPVFMWLGLLLCLLPLSLCAKLKNDSIITEAGYGMVRTNMNVAYDHTWASVRDGFSARVSYLCYQNRMFTLTANARYNSVTTDFRDSEFPIGYSPEALGMNDTHLTGNLGLSATMRMLLFGKPLLVFGSVNTDWSKGGYARTSGLLMGLLLLRYSSDTQFGIGPLVLVNSVSKVPAFPVFIYRHRFNDQWLINLYGGMMGVDYTPTRDDLIAIGGDIDVKTFFFEPHAEGLPDRCMYRKTAFRPMVKYRRRLKLNLYWELECGASVKMSSRVNGLTGTKEYLKVEQKTALFVQTGVSYAL